MRHRNAGRRRPADAGADPGDDAEADAGRRQRQRLLPAATEHQRIAALQPHHAMPLPRQADQPLIDAKLRRAAPAGALADRFQPRLRRQRQDLRRHQRVVQHDIGCPRARARRAASASPGRRGRRRPARRCLARRSCEPPVGLQQRVGQRRHVASVPPPRRAMLAQQGDAIGPFRAVFRRQPRPDARGEAGAGPSRWKPSAADRHAAPRRRCGSRIAPADPRR